MTEKLNYARCGDCRFFKLAEWESCGYCEKTKASVCHLDRWCGDFEPIPPEKPKDVREQVKAIPEQNFLHADRYDTDTDHTVHLWDDKGNSYDIRVPKENATVTVTIDEQERSCKTCKHSRMERDGVHFTQQCLSCHNNSLWESKQ